MQCTSVQGESARSSPPRARRKTSAIKWSADTPLAQYAHLYELTPTQLDEMKRGAKFHICNALLNGLECEDTACVYGHVCPRGSVSRGAAPQVLSH